MLTGIIVQPWLKFKIDLPKVKQAMTEVVNLSADQECKPLELQFIHDWSSSSVDQSSWLKFESLILHIKIKDPTARIKSERLDQMHLMLQ